MLLGDGGTQGREQHLPKVVTQQWQTGRGTLTSREWKTREWKSRETEKYLKRRF